MSASILRPFLYGAMAALLGIASAVTLETRRGTVARAASPAPDSDEVDGRRAWQRHACADCHTILGSGSFYAVDLTTVYRRSGEAGIRRAVRTPEQVTTWRSMPHIAVTDDELDDIVAFLRWTSEIGSHDWPTEDARLRISLPPAGARSPEAMR
jgi:nitric oxide reductase subunit C